MLDWLLKNISTIIICTILIIAIAVIVIKMIKNKGKSSCSGNCSNCQVNGSCHKK